VLLLRNCQGADNLACKDGALVTPPVYLGALRGITRDAIMEIARGMGVPVREECFTRFEVFDADECFLTGTAAEAIPVVKVDTRVIGDGKPGPMTKELVQRFRQIVNKDGEMV